MGLIQEVRGHLAECVDSLPKSFCSFLATYDGHLIGLYARQELAIGENLPMASSIHALAQSFVDGLQPGARLDDVIVRSHDRVVSMVGVGDAHNVLFLGIVADRMVNLGQLLVKGKACADAIRELALKEPQ